MELRPSLRREAPAVGPLAPAIHHIIRHRSMSNRRRFTTNRRGGKGGCGQGGSNPITKNCGKIAEKLRRCNQTKLNLPKPQGAIILHRSLRMLKEIESSTGISITTTSSPQYHHETEA